MASLSDKDQRGYYGLLVQPTFEQAFKSAARPLHIPLPDRQAKWEALSPYREYKLELQREHLDQESKAIEYRRNNRELPYLADQVKTSSAGDDPSFSAMDAQGRSRSASVVEEASVSSHNAETQREAVAARARALRATHRHTSRNPVLAAEHHNIGSDSEETISPMSTPRGQPRAPVQLPQKAGYTPHAEFPTFRALNEGRDNGARSSAWAGVWRPGNEESYESMRAKR